MTTPPDTANKYPSEEQVAALIAEYFNSIGHRGMRYEAFLIMKAAEIQREQDALICEAQAKEPECPERAQYCADAIRHQEAKSND